MSYNDSWAYSVCCENGTSPYEMMAKFLKSNTDFLHHIVVVLEGDIADIIHQKYYREFEEFVELAGKHEHIAQSEWD